MNLRDVDQDNKAWVIMWRTHERPLGVRVVPVANLKFPDAKFKVSDWTMVIYWKETTGLQMTVCPPKRKTVPPAPANTFPRSESADTATRTAIGTPWCT